MSDELTKRQRLQRQARAAAEADPPSCELCADVRTIMHLHARCHPAAPLRIELSESVLTLYCYVPQCNRRVGAFKVTAIKP